MGDKQPQQLHVVLFPFMATTLGIARLFASRGVKTTLITTHANATILTMAFAKDNNNSETPDIDIELFNFSAQEAGLPEGCDNLEQAIRHKVMDRFFKASVLLRDQLEQFLEKIRPNCLVADMFFAWATTSAAKFNIPRLVFHGTCFFSLCAMEINRLYKPYKNFSSDTETFILPCLPHEVQLTRLQMSEEIYIFEFSI